MKWKLSLCVVLAFFAASGMVQAAPLTLTAAGSGLGFGLSVFASGLPNQGANQFGPVGVTSTSAGNILVTDFANTTTYSFNDVDGQTPGTAIHSSVFSTFLGLTNAGGQIFGVNLNTNQLDKLNNDGTFNSVFLSNGAYLGIATNPVDQHIYLQTNTGLIKDIDPITGASRNVASVSGDGLTVSPDGKTVYSAVGGGINGYDTTTGALVFSSGFITGSADGAAVIQGSSSLAGKIVVNTNTNGVFLLDPVTHALTQIASGGSRGDFVGYDLTNGSLFITQTDSVDRLTCTGCVFATATVPEPSTITLLGLGLLGLGFLKRKKA